MPISWAHLIVLDQLTQSFRDHRAKSTGLPRECDRVDLDRNRSCKGRPGHMKRLTSNFNKSRPAPSCILNGTESELQHIVCVENRRGPGGNLRTCNSNHTADGTKQICLNPRSNNRSCNIPYYFKGKKNTNQTLNGTYWICGDKADS